MKDRATPVPPDLAGRSGTARWMRWAAVGVLTLHGLVHVMGFALLLELGEPGDLVYADARPTSGSGLAVFFAALWALAGGLFVVAAFRLARQHPAGGITVAACLVSLGAVGIMVDVAPIGVLVSLVILIVALWSDASTSRGNE